MANTIVSRLIETIDGPSIHQTYEATVFTSTDCCLQAQLAYPLNNGDNPLTAPAKATKLLIENSTPILKLSASGGTGGWPCAAGQRIEMPVVAGLVYVLNAASPGTCDLRWR